jgi:hypothetical protein
VLLSLSPRLQHFLRGTVVGNKEKAVAWQSVNPAVIRKQQDTLLDFRRVSAPSHIGFVHSEAWVFLFLRASEGARVEELVCEN